jgi:hypothetical protein
MQLWPSVRNTGGAKENHDKGQDNWFGLRSERGILQICSSRRILRESGTHSVTERPKLVTVYANDLISFRNNINIEQNNAEISVNKLYRNKCRQNQIFTQEHDT